MELEKLEKIDSSNLIFKDSLCFLNFLKKLNKNIFLASSSKNSHMILSKLNIAHYFDSIYDGNSIETNYLNPKPSPDIFNFCISINSLKQNNTVVFQPSLIACKLHPNTFVLSLS